MTVTGVVKYDFNLVGNLKVHFQSYLPHFLLLLLHSLSPPPPPPLHCWRKSERVSFFVH